MVARYFIQNLLNLIQTEEELIIRQYSRGIAYRLSSVTTTDLNKFTTTILEHYLPLTRHTQPPAIGNNQDSQFPEVSWFEIALLISFTFLRPGKKSAFQVKGKGFAFCEKHTVSSRSYLWLRLYASHNTKYLFQPHLYENRHHKKKAGKSMNMWKLNNDS